MKLVRETGTRALAILILVLFASGATLMSLGKADGGREVAGNQGWSDSTVEDIDGNIYRTVRIGEQMWMAESLRVTRYRNGDVVPKVTGDTEWAGLSTGALSAYDNDERHVRIFGFLYNWFAIDDARGLAPEGWHVPTDEDWKELERYLGMSQEELNGTAWRGTDAGGKLKAAGTALWSGPNAGATNETGFTALPGGYRVHRGPFVEMGNTGGFWTSTEHDGSTAWARGVYFEYPTVYRYNYPKLRGFSVRCIKDSPTGVTHSPN